MAPPFPSIQSFFHADTSSSPTKSQFTPVDDGFTAAEVENALHPTLPEWRPRGEYEDVDIGEIIPGKGSVSIMGRVVNFHDSPISGKAPHSAQGCIRLLVQDDTGLLAVCLYIVLIYSMLMIDTDQAILHQDRFLSTPWPARLDLDFPYLHNGSQRCGNWHCNRFLHNDLPRAGQHLLLHDPGPKRRRDSLQIASRR